jgi:double-stranded uracil-DNA glycosylase
MSVDLQRDRSVVDNEAASRKGGYFVGNRESRVASVSAVDILQDLLRPGLRLVICGTAASTRSAEIGAYYAGPGNKFWPTMHAVGLTPRLLAPQDWRSLDALGIGFTDLVKSHSGMDKDLPPGSFDAGRVRGSIENHQPSVLAFNGKTAAKAFFGRALVDFGRQQDMVGETSIWVLPSTSGAASGAWDIEHWHALARDIDDCQRRSLCRGDPI